MPKAVQLSKEEEADKAVKDANKLISPSCCDFRLSPDWDNAGPLLDRAVMLYKVAGKIDKAIDTAERASLCQEKLKSPWHAAKHMETCADLSATKKDHEQVAHYYKLAADLYVDSGKPMTAAEALTKGAKAVQTDNLETATEMYMEAIDIYEGEGREKQGADVFRFAIAATIKAKKYDDAVALEMRYGASCDAAGQVSNQCRAYLSAVVIHLFANNAEGAWGTYQEAMDVEAFANSDEALLADGLFEAYRSGTDDRVKEYVSKKHVFKNLDTHVAKLAVKLPNGRAQKLAKKIDALMEGGEEEEEKEEDLL